MLKRLLIVLVAALLSSCANVGPITHVKVERSPCARGSCPAYSLEVANDGSIKYIGLSHVKVVGSASSSVSTEDWTLLRRAIESTQFFAMKDGYGFASDHCNVLWNHHPTIKISVTRGRNTKQVSYYAGCRGLREGNLLAWLADTADMVTSSGKWWAAESP